MARYLFLIPILPFAGFLVNGLAGRRLPRWAVSLVGCAGPTAAAVLAGLAFSEVAAGPASVLQASLGDWIRAGRDFHVPLALSLDRLSGVMALVVTGVGTLIHVYSIGYMREDPGYARFFAYLNLFMAAMLVLVLADNILLLFLGWEGVGLCSYLLIGFWYKDLSNCDAGIKAFVVNRIGDFGFILGVFLIFITFGTFELEAIDSRAAAAAARDPLVMKAIALLLFLGATGKSAQIPLYVWLPDAMAGPTPVSALIHAATMVTSGVYLLARLDQLFLASGALPVVAWIGALTALLAALIALAQTDIKKVLAYSTVSQLGYMFLACGVAAFPVAIFHLVTHAFFKAVLFLGAGAVIHSLHHEQDMRRMGGLFRRIPLTGAVFLAGALALSGFPLTSGFFSKDEILHETLSGGQGLLYSVGLTTAVLTAFYAFRQFALVFLGTYRGAGAERGDAHGGGHGTFPPRSPRGDEHTFPPRSPRGDEHTFPPRSPRGDEHGHGAHEIHGSPPSMMAPLAVLAFLALCGGFLAVPHFLAGSGETAAHAAAGTAGAEGQVTGWIVGGAATVLGILAALGLFVWRPALRERIVQGTAGGRLLARLSLDKLYVDELYDALVVKPFWFLSHVLFLVIDRFVIDFACVRGTGLLARTLGAALGRLQTGKIPSYAFYFVGGVLVLMTLVLWAAG
ncbi:MAG: NADH-quinone oxidoreductase subunit L [Planctomycetes bacterium]|nr:NADH-quinone oxidoreductase subunit L [Planctomycetota bacterium]